MSIDTVLRELDLEAATEQELQSQYRMLPIRYDRATLLPKATEVAAWIEPQLVQGSYGAEPASIVFADKASRGLRPLAEMDLKDRVLYRALVNHISESMPEHLITRQPFADFQHSAAPDDAKKGYVSKTDIAAYYDYVDHSLLQSELLAQTGDGPAVLLLMDLLRALMGRRVGLPQVHKGSDILGDCYIDPLRRRLARSGLLVSSYSDDFRIYSSTLAEAKSAIERCAFEARRLGLVLNESKTLTYAVENYFESLDSFDDAQERILGQENSLITSVRIDHYVDSTTRKQELEELLDSVRQLKGRAEDESHDGECPSSVDPGEISEAAKQVWDAWAHPDTDVSPEDAALVRRLLVEVLPILGKAHNLNPLKSLSKLMRSEPSLTPAVSEYVINLSKSDGATRQEIRKSLEDLVSQESLSTWQQMWIADAAGSIVASNNRDRPLYTWLTRQMDSASGPLAATCAAAAGRLEVGDTASLRDTAGNVGAAWRGLAFWGLAQFDPDAAVLAAENQAERMIVEAVV